MVLWLLVLVRGLLVLTPQLAQATRVSRGTVVAWSAAAVAAVSVRGNCIRLVSHSVAVKAVT